MANKTNETTLENQEKGIVLNRMYTGSYLSTNLGHEVINMFQADNGKHYLYLNAKGNFSSQGKNVGTMLLVRGIGDNRVEVVGMAKNLHPVESACCTLPRDLGIINELVREGQKAFVTSREHQIKYGNVPIFDIFGEKGQQSVYVSYWVENDNFYKPNKGKRIIIEFPPSNKKKSDNYKNTHSKEYSEDKNTVTIRMKEHNFASTSLHQFILEGDDMSNLTDLCNENGLWITDNNKADSQANVEEKELSLFDICQIQKDENKFSNALSYFIDKYPKLWCSFFAQELKIDLGEIESVTREENAKVDSDKYMKDTGGRIDLLIRTKKYYIILENKIDSDIIRTNGVTQLERYYNYVEYLREDAKKTIEKEKKKLISLRDEKIVKIFKSKTPNGPRVMGWQREIKEYQQKIQKLCDDMILLEARTTIGFVLAPDYNMPEETKRQVKDDNQNVCDTYQELRYSKIYNWLKERATIELSQDSNFKAFHDAMKRHIYVYENDSLYEDMKNTFFARIKNCTPTSSNTVENA